MRRKIALLLCLGFWHSVSVLAQNVSLQQTLLSANKAFSGGGSISTVVLTGQVTRYAGSDTTSGVITLTARSDGSSSIKTQLGSGELSEAQDTFANGQGCSWSGADSVLHNASAHNCIIPFAWFLPEAAFFSAQMPANGALSIDATSSVKQLSLHWARVLPANSDRDQASLLAHIGAYDLSLDASSFLPTSLSYSVHPDDNAGVDIPVAIQYSDYRMVDGVNIPFHIERYFNGVLQLDITISNATINH